MATKTTRTTRTSKPRARAVHDPDKHGVVNGYRSGLEDLNADHLKALGYEVEYETISIPYTPPLKTRRYTPDFPLKNGIIVETKGRFLTADRQKHKHIKDEHPDLDIRFVFSNSRAKLSKGSATTYAMWCEKNGFLYADRLIPDAWLNEPPEPRRVEALRRIAIRKPK